MNFRVGIIRPGFTLKGFSKLGEDHDQNLHAPWRSDIADVTEGIDDALPFPMPLGVQVKEVIPRPNVFHPKGFGLAREAEEIVGLPPRALNEIGMECLTSLRPLRAG